VRGIGKKVRQERKEDLKKNKGKLAGAIVMINDARELKPQDKAALERYDDAELEKLAAYEVPQLNDTRRREAQTRREFRRALAQFAMDEKIAVLIQVGRGGGGTANVQAGCGSWNPD